MKKKQKLRCELSNLHNPQQKFRYVWNSKILRDNATEGQKTLN